MQREQERQEKHEKDREEKQAQERQSEEQFSKHAPKVRPFWFLAIGLVLTLAALFIWWRAWFAV